MSLRQKFARLIGGKEFVHSSIVGMTGGINIFGWNPEENPVNLIKMVKSWSYTCISRNTSALAQVPLRLYIAKQKGVSGQKEYKTETVDIVRQKFLRPKLANSLSGKFDLEEIIDHPIIDLLRVVNPGQNGFQLKQMTFEYLEVLGRAIWYLERGAADKIINIWPLFVQNITLKQDKTTGKILGFVYGQGLRKKTFDPKDIVYFKNTSLLGPDKFQSPTMAGVQAIDLHDYANRFQLASFKNGGVPGMVMTVPIDGSLPTDERKRIESEFNTKHVGVEKTGKLITATGGATFAEFGHSPREMSFLKGKDSTLTEICGVYGVPTSFVKIDAVSRANALSAERQYGQFTLNPRLVQNEQKLNEQFTPNWGDNLFLLYDDAIPKDREFRLQELKAHLENDYSDVNEERAIDGLEPVEWGSGPRQPATPAEDTEPEPPIKAINVKPVEKREGPKNDLPEPDFTPTVMLTMLTILFKEMENDIIRGLNALKSFSHTKDTDADLIGSIFNNVKWEKRLEADMLPFIKGLMVQGVLDALEKVSPQAVFNPTSPEILLALETRQGQIKTIIGTREAEIREMLKEGIAAGESRSQLIKRIRANFDARGIADMVVRTETIWAHNEGTIEGWKQSGVVRAKQWDTAEDERVCQFCNPMHDKIVGLDGQYFAKGDEMIGERGGKLSMAYGEVKHPPLHPRCRCSLIPILIED